MIGTKKEEGWTQYGRIGFEDGKLTYPLGDVPDVPGLYRLDFDAKTVYFGETGDLRRRVGDYLKYYAATGIESEFRINRALETFKGAEVAIVTNQDLQSRSQRCTVESRLLKEAKQEGWNLLNGGTIPGRIAFHASEIIRLSAKLKPAQSAEGAEI